MSKIEIESTALESLKAMAQRLQHERDELLGALQEVLAAERFSNRPPETVMQAHEKLDRIRKAAIRADAIIAKCTQEQPVSDWQERMK